MCYPVRHSDSVSSAAVVNGRAADDCLDWIAVTNGIIHTLDQEARSTLATTETRSLRIV